MLVERNDLHLGKSFMSALLIESYEQCCFLNAATSCILFIHKHA